MRNRDIIITGIQAWEIKIGSNSKNIAMVWAKHNRVLYVNSPLDRMTIFHGKNNPDVAQRLQALRKKARIDKIHHNLWTLSPGVIIESISQVRPAWLFDRLNRINNKRLAGEILHAIEELEFKNYILFNDSDIFRSFYLQELLKPAAYIYYTRDNLLGVDYWQTNGLRIEPQHMKKADLVVANSAYLARQAQKYNPNSVDVGQGCDLSLIEKARKNPALPVPADLAGLPRPIIGYFGALNGLRLDTKLIAYIAEQKPEWSLVLVGPEDAIFRVSDLHQLANVHFLGNKKPEELPGYVNEFSVAINPQLVNELTIGNYPRKIDEYLALGKPTVAVKTAAMEIFADQVHLAENSEQFLLLCEQALQENTNDKMNARTAFAATHTWENSVERINCALRICKPEAYENNRSC
jgi:glycosyltransferase involved in cell wall biosynthesis